jgi:addiction module HigA family antidote
MLLRDFIEPLGLTQNRLARAIGVPPRRINEIVLGKRAITADTDLRLARFFGLSEGFWLGVQADYDLMERRRQIATDLENIAPLDTAA